VQAKTPKGYISLGDTTEKRTTPKKKAIPDSSRSRVEDAKERSEKHAKTRMEEVLKQTQKQLDELSKIIKE